MEDFLFIAMLDKQDFVILSLSGDILGETDFSLSHLLSAQAYV